MVHSFKEFVGESVCKHNGLHTCELARALICLFAWRDIDLARLCRLDLLVFRQALTLAGLHYTSQNGGRCVSLVIRSLACVSLS